MANEIAKKDDNRNPVLLGVTNDDAQEVKMVRVDPTTKRVLVDINATATYEVLLDKANDSVAGWTNTAKDGTGTPVQPIADSDGHLQ
ncbi:hypothetical protein, partial [Candidatus Oleimmundimicrobium sp.]|uniref:hypothetical protein n=1 Tax=Candidatus Oleimmundimicrobium sp. TaxID=3060597 RepID=UPI00272112D4